MAATKKIFDPESITGFINAISVPDTVSGTAEVSAKRKMEPAKSLGIWQFSSK